MRAWKRTHAIALDEKKRKPDGKNTGGGGLTKENKD